VQGKVPLDPSQDWATTVNAATALSELTVVCYNYNSSIHQL